MFTIYKGNDFSCGCLPDLAWNPAYNAGNILVVSLLVDSICTNDVIINMYLLQLPLLAECGYSNPILPVYATFQRGHKVPFPSENSILKQLNVLYNNTIACSVKVNHSKKWIIRKNAWLLLKHEFKQSSDFLSKSFQYSGSTCTCKYSIMCWLHSAGVYRHTFQKWLSVAYLHVSPLPVQLWTTQVIIVVIGMFMSSTVAEYV